MALLWCGKMHGKLLGHLVSVMIFLELAFSIGVANAFHPSSSQFLQSKAVQWGDVFFRSNFYFLFTVW